MIRLIAKSVVNWQNLVQSLKDFAGIDISLNFSAPTAHRMSHYLQLLSQLSSNDPFDDNNLKMVHCTFVVKIETYDLLDLLVNTQLKVVSRPIKGDSFLCLISGSLLAWKQAVIYACDESAEKEGRQTFNRIFAILEEEGVKEIWKSYWWKTLSDGTGTLVERTQ